MPRPRTPLAVAKLTGADKKNPDRYANRREPERNGPIGDPPGELNDLERLAWTKFAKEWSWLAESDRAALLPLCQLRARIENPTEPVPIGVYTEYRIALNSFGGNPTARTKVHAPAEDDEDDPWASFE